MDVCRFVPVIKMKVDGIPVDLLFVSLKLDAVPVDIDMLDDKYLKGLDEASVRSCNGVRVTERILQLVPNPETFRTTLIAVKHWARVRYRQRRTIRYGVAAFVRDELPCREAMLWCTDARDLLERAGVSWWRQLGHPRRTDLPVLSERVACVHTLALLPDLPDVDMAEPNHARQSGRSAESRLLGDATAFVLVFAILTRQFLVSLLTRPQYVLSCDVELTRGID